MATGSEPTTTGPLDISVTVSDDHARIALAGDIDIINATQVRSLAYQHLDEPHIDQVTADLGAVTFLDSSGLRALVHSRRHAEELGKTFRIENHRGHIAKVIEITGLDRFLTDPTYQP